jgi:hypothetical protein
LVTGFAATAAAETTAGSAFVEDDHDSPGFLPVGLRIVRYCGIVFALAEQLAAAVVAGVPAGDKPPEAILAGAAGGTVGTAGQSSPVLQAPSSRTTELTATMVDGIRMSLSSLRSQI